MYRGSIVETAATDDIVNRPSHLYTRLLVGSAPTVTSAGSIDRHLRAQLEAASWNASASVAAPPSEFPISQPSRRFSPVLRRSSKEPYHARASLSSRLPLSSLGHTVLPHLYRAFIELFRYAEELGFDAGWVAQHHFEDGRHGPGAGASPLTFLTAVAENTKYLRLGTAVVTLPLESMIRLAEDAATLDVISGGRLELDIS